MSTSFAVAFDYRCPFARNAAEHVLTGLAAGADWQVRWVPFSLSQSKEETWSEEADSGLRALQLAVAVRDGQPERFDAAHAALFGVRHDRGLDLRDLDVLRDTLADAGVDVTEAEVAVKEGAALATVRADHEWAVATHKVWGVPTFLAGDQAVFVRLMNRPDGDPSHSVQAIERIVDLLVGWPELNEFKHTSVPR